MKEITLHTDGACNPNPGPGGRAVLFEGRNNYLELSGAVKEKTTNNRMEVLAACEGLESLEGSWRVKVRTDSMYLIYAGRRFGTRKKTKTNHDLVERLHQAMKGHEVEFVYVKGHAGDRWNERADELAESHCPRIYFQKSA
jgi:ribonuclease HI